MAQPPSLVSILSISSPACMLLAQRGCRPLQICCFSPEEVEMGQLQGTAEYTPPHLVGKHSSGGGEFLFINTTQTGARELERGPRPLKPSPRTLVQISKGQEGSAGSRGVCWLERGLLAEPEDDVTILSCLRSCYFCPRGQPV